MMDSLERQLIEAELAQLVHRFSHCMDKSRYDELCSLFTEDAIFDRVGDVLEGRQAIRDAMRNRHSFFTRHTVSNLLFSRIEADEAEASMYVANFVGQPSDGQAPTGYALPQPAIIDFDDIYRRTPEGWRIARRVAKLVIKPDQVPGH